MVSLSPSDEGDGVLDTQPLPPCTAGAGRGCCTHRKCLTFHLWSPLGLWLMLTRCRVLLMTTLYSGLLGNPWGLLAEETTEAPLPPEEAARTMLVPEGFQVTLFAGEPDVRQPISFCIDDRGRLWVAEAYSYPQHNSERPDAAGDSREEQPPSGSEDRGARNAAPSPGTEQTVPPPASAGTPDSSRSTRHSPRDRILILEDVDNDGRFDRRTVFFEGLNYVTGVEVGFGGAWVMSPPYFLFIPDRNRDDVPDGPPQVLLDGFGNHANSHNLANGFAWGPDGWLYGTHGRTNWSLIGQPGTPQEQRMRFDGGVYRYHPIRHEWEPYADGTTNPWGIDWDDWGEAFVCNCVTPHLYHVIQGAHYEPWRERESSRYAYERIATIADHLHFTGTANVRDGLATGADDVIGGGHAHCGTMVYLGDNWPAGYRNTVFMHNIHGKRVNNDLLRRSGSGYVASHAPDVLRSRDPWMMGVTLAYGPDGSVYLSDWSDTGECHSVKNTRRETGRIFRVAYGTPEPRRVDVATLSNGQLVDLQLHPNEWFVRHARRVLQERHAAGEDLADVPQRLLRMYHEQTDVTRKLRALWALFVLDALDQNFLIAQLDAPEETIRGWSVTLLAEDRRPPADALAKFVQLAREDDSPLVRRRLASALQRLAPEQVWPIVEALAARGEDAADQNLPLMYWYAIEPLIRADRPRFIQLAATADIPLLRRHIARRAVGFEPAAESRERLVTLLATLPAGAPRRDVLRGMLQGLEGHRTVPMPAGWRSTFEVLRSDGDPAVRETSLQLALVFDDPVALASLREAAADVSRPPDERIRAVNALVARQPPDLSPLLLALVNDAAVRSAAVRGLAAYRDPETPHVLLAAYPALDPAQRQDVLQTLASRPEWAAALLDAVESQRIPAGDLTAFTSRQLQTLGDDRITERVRKLWGEVRDTPAERQRQIETYRRRLTPAVLAQADPVAGRQQFQKLCANCHKLFGEGGAIGPDITGSQRKNLDYLLENLLDPSAAVARDYQMDVILTDGGRVITGLVVGESDAALTVQTVNERVVVPKAEIDSRRKSPLSLMPDGMLNNLSPTQVRDLLGYLMGDRQVSLPEAAATGR